MIGYGETRPMPVRVAGPSPESRVHGVATNRDLLVESRCEPEFRAGAIDTTALPNATTPDSGHREQPAGVNGARGGGGTMAAQAERRSATTILGPAVRLPHPAQRTAAGEFHLRRRRGGRGLRFERGRVRVSVNGETVDVVPALQRHGDLVDAEIDGVRRGYRVLSDGLDVYVDSSLGASALREIDRFPDPSTLAEARIAGGADAGEPWCASR